MQMVRINSLADYESLPINRWGIPEPTWEEKREEALESGLDLVIMPGLAFDRTKARLGHGKG